VAADMVNTPRAFFAVANEGLLPVPLTLVHKKFHTPHIAIMVYATMVFVFTISGAFRPLAVLATISQLLVYFVVCIGVLRLRHLRGSVSGGFRTPGGPVVPLIGAAAVVWLLSHSTAAEVAAIAVMLVAASVYYVMRTRLSRVKNEA
jgi:amino acid transporter